MLARPTIKTIERVVARTATVGLRLHHRQARLNFVTRRAETGLPSRKASRSFDNSAADS